MEKEKTEYTFFVNLFETNSRTYEPLASRMRPTSLDQYIGQSHILGPGRLLRRSIESDKLTSLILSGPPGTGKTTLARVVAQATKGAFLSVNAVLSGVKEIRELIEKAQETRQLQGRKTILFVDEVHRWNKSQQDALLPWVENGTFILIGATTENPFFEVNAALVSRSRVFTLLPLTEEELGQIAAQALDDARRGYGAFRVEWEPGALEHLVKMASGDARSLLNALELAVESSCVPFPPASGERIWISLTAAEESIQKKAVLYDKDGDYHYDTISAFIKSLRGSDPDAAVYWLARMVQAGEDPAFLFRRMLILASEDVGLADPQALVVTQAAAEAFRKVGLPEGQYFLAHAALYLATCPKSNSVGGYFEALATLERSRTGEVPSALKDASRDGPAMGHGKGYVYPHEHDQHWVNQQYLPAGMSTQVFYRPSDQGYEGQIRETVLERRAQVLQSTWADDGGNLTYTKPQETPWLRRLEREDPGQVQALVDELLRIAALARHHRVWIARDIGGRLLFAALKLVPEGQVLVSCSDPDRAADLAESVSFLPELHRPVVLSSGWGVAEFDGKVDCILAIGTDSLPPGWADSELLMSRIEEGGRLVVADPNDLGGPRLCSALGQLTGDLVSRDDFEALSALEDEFLHRRDHLGRLRGWGFEIREVTVPGTRKVTPQQWKSWWTLGRPGSWPEFLIEKSQNWAPVLKSMSDLPPAIPVPWPQSWWIGSRSKGKR